ncbi:Light-harvesting complex-like protein 3 isotype 1, chloroplastic [Linum perenne]
MASSVSISASVQSRACCSHATLPKPTTTTRSMASKQATHLTTSTSSTDGQKGTASSSTMVVPKVGAIDDVQRLEAEAESSGVKFVDERWKKGNWDLNMFVKDGEMDWDALIVAEAQRRRKLELFPEASTNEEPVLFRSSIIPWWAWLKRSYLPQAELLNGRAAMLGFFMGYAVDALTGMDMVGQTGNWVCKTAILVTLLGVILLRRTEDVKKLRKLADEATFYDKQWKATWVQDQDSPI